MWLSLNVIRINLVCFGLLAGVIKAGFAGDTIPKCIFLNLVGHPKHIRVMAGALEGEHFIGRRAEEHRGLLSIKYPMEHGIVTDWNEMEKIWHYIYSKEQLQTFSEEHPVLLTGKLCALCLLCKVLTFFKFI